MVSGLSDTVTSLVIPATSVVHTGVFQWRYSAEKYPSIPMTRNDVRMYSLTAAHR